MSKEIRLVAIQGIPLIQEGDKIGTLVAECCQTSDISIEDGDVVVVAQKIVSKSEGAVVDLKSVTPSAAAQKLAEQTGRDARLCQVYLDEASEVIAVKGRMIITRHKLGFVNSNSLVDRSNIAAHQDLMVVVLPKDPDQSARNIQKQILDATGKFVAVVINDSLGRDTRDGSVGMAIGIAGISHLEFRKQRDLFENESNSRIALIDELAAAASMLMGQADEKTPAVLVRGAPYSRNNDAHIKEILV